VPPPDFNSNSLLRTLPRPDPNAILERQDEDLSVTDFPLGSAARATDDRVDRGFDKLIVDRDLETDLAKQVHLVLVSAINLGVTFLAPEALDVTHCKPEDFDLAQRLLDRLEPCGLNSIKITLDGDKATHDQMRPLRGGQGTFDKIVENIRRVAHRCNISIGGNFDEDTVESYPALLDFLQEQEFADSLVQVSFKPVIREKPATSLPGVIPLTAVGTNDKPLGGTCMTSTGAGTASICDSCNLLDTKMADLREETKKHGFATLDGFHMGPCDIHRRHSYTVGPEGSLYACPGFTGELTAATGHISGDLEERHRRSAADFESLAAWKSCGECHFIPVCAGGCSVASKSELGDMHKPTCHKTSMDSALVSFALEHAGGA